MGLSYKYLFNYEIGFTIICCLQILAGVFMIYIWVQKITKIDKFVQLAKIFHSFANNLLISSIEAGFLLNTVSILLNVSIYTYKYDRDISNYLIAFIMAIYLIFFFI
jgi:hypothetical protein